MSTPWRLAAMAFMVVLLLVATQDSQQAAIRNPGVPMSRSFGDECCVAQGINKCVDCAKTHPRKAAAAGVITIIVMAVGLIYLHVNLNASGKRTTNIGGASSTTVASATTVLNGFSKKLLIGGAVTVGVTVIASLAFYFWRKKGGDENGMAKSANKSKKSSKKEGPAASTHGTDDVASLVPSSLNTPMSSKKSAKSILLSMSTSRSNAKSTLNSGVSTGGSALSYVSGLSDSGSSAITSKLQFSKMGISEAGSIAASSKVGSSPGSIHSTTFETPKSKAPKPAPDVTSRTGNSKPGSTILAASKTSSAKGSRVKSSK